MSLKSFFVKEDENPKQKTQATKTSQDQPHKDAVSISSVSFDTTLPTNTTATGGDKAKFTKYFRDLMIKSSAAVSGPDYEKFVLAFDKMKSQPIDEASKFKNVFITLESMGLTLPNLIDSSKFYKDAFVKAKQAFDNQIADTNTKEITTRENKAKDLTAKNAAIDVQMTELNKQKLKNEQDISKTQEEKQSILSQLSAQSGDFNAAYKDSCDEIDHNVELFNKYLTETATA